MAQLLTSPVKVPTRGDFGHRNGTGPRARTGRSDARVTLDDEGHAYHRSGTAEVLEIRRDDEAGPAEHGAATAVYDAEPEVAPFRYDDLDSDASDGDGALGGLGGAAASFIRPRSSGSSRPRTSKSRPGSSHSRASAGGGIHGALSRAKSASAGTGRQRGSRRSRRPSTGASRGGRPKTTGGLSRRRPDYASTWGDKLHFSRRPRGDPLMTRHLPLHLRKNTFFSSHPPLKPPPSALNRFVPLDERRFTTFEQLADEYDYLDDPRRLERSRPGTSAMKLLRKKSSRQMDYAREFLQPETPSPGAFGPTSSTLPRTSSGYGQRLRSRGPTEEEENPFAPSPMKRTFSSIDAFKIKPDAEEYVALAWRSIAAPFPNQESHVFQVAPQS